MRKVKTATTLALSVIMVLGMTACSDLERKVFQTLSSSKAVVDEADADYRAGTIRRTQTAFDAITAAKAAQVVAVNAFDAFDQLRRDIAEGKVANDPGALAAKQKAVFDALADVVKLTAPVKALLVAVKKAG